VNDERVVKEMEGRGQNEKLGNGGVEEKSKVDQKRPGATQTVGRRKK